MGIDDRVINSGSRSGFSDIVTLLSEFKTSQLGSPGDCEFRETQISQRLWGFGMPRNSDIASDQLRPFP